MCLVVGCLCQLGARAQISIAVTNAPKLAQNVALAWNASPDSTVAGYYLYYGTNSGTYISKLDVGNFLTTTINVSPRGTLYYFAVVAHDANGQESPPSNEISYSVPNLIPQSPLVLLPQAPLAFASTNPISASGGSGSGTLVYSVLDGPGYLTADSNNVVVTAATGTILLKATKGADDVYLETSVTNAISVTSAFQMITFAPIPSQKETNIVNLSAASSSGLPVSFSVVSGPGAIAGNQLSFSGPGTVIVAAAQPGNAQYFAATPVSTTVNVTAVLWPGMTLSTNLLSFEAPYLGTNPPSGSFALNNTGEIPISFTNSISYSSGAAGWLTVTPAGGSVAAFGSMNMTISVNTAGLPPGNYVATSTIASAQATNSPLQWVAQLTVDRTTQNSLVFNPATAQACGITNALSVTGGSGSGAVTFSVVTGPGMIVGNGNQLLVTAGSGQVVVQATKAGDTNYTSASTNAVITALKGTQVISFPSIGQTKSTNVVTLTASATSKLPVAFAVVSGPGTISAGQLRFSSTGTVLVSACQPGDSNYRAATPVTNTITVIPYLTAPAEFRIITGN